MSARTAKLFTSGGSQAVRLPAEFRFPGREVKIRRDVSTGDVILAAVPGQKFDNWADFVEAFKDVVVPEDFMNDRPLNQPLQLRDPFSEEDDKP
jgi:antitoxin VapB